MDWQWQLGLSLLVLVATPIVNAIVTTKVLDARLGGITDRLVLTEAATQRAHTRLDEILRRRRP